jgi:hypothetical protein
VRVTQPVKVNNSAANGTDINKQRDRAFITQFNLISRSGKPGFHVGNVMLAFPMNRGLLFAFGQIPTGVLVDQRKS